MSNSEDLKPILIIEDVDNLLQLLELTLKFKGFRTLTAVDGLDGLEKLNETLPSLIITDIMMPRLDGYSLLQKIRTSKLEYANVPVVLLTATYVTPEDKDFALSLGATKFVTKPIDTEQFVNTIHEILAEQRSNDVPPMAPKDFYNRYKERLENKLAQKNAHISRMNLLLPNLNESQKSTYQSILSNATHDRENIINELAEINQLLLDITP